MRTTGEGPESDAAASVPPVEDPEILAALAERQDRVDWRGWDALGIGVLTFFTLGLVYLFTPASVDPEAPPVPLLDSGALLLVTLGWLAWARRAGAVRRAFGPRFHVPGLRRTLVLAALIGVAAPLLDTALFALLEALDVTLPPLQEHIQEWIRTTPVLGLVVLDIVVLTPVAEELLFRGVLFQGLARNWGFWPSAVTSGAVFGLLHVESAGPDSVFIALTTGLFGVALAWLLHRRRTLLGPIAAHMVVNGIGTALFLAS